MRTALAVVAAALLLAGCGSAASPVKTSEAPVATPDPAGDAAAEDFMDTPVEGGIETEADTPSADDTSAKSPAGLLNTIDGGDEGAEHYVARLNRIARLCHDKPIHIADLIAHAYNELDEILMADEILTTTYVRTAAGPVPMSACRAL